MTPLKASAEQISVESQIKAIADNILSAYPDLIAEIKIKQKKKSGSGEDPADSSASKEVLDDE